MKNFTITFLPALLLAVLFVPAHTFAQTSSFGGWPERFKGKGDRIPPECVFDVPASASQPFFVKWNCTDDYTLESDIRTELWMLRKNATAAQKVSQFLGFPASVLINEGLLQSEALTDGLPVSFRLLAWDRAGNEVVTPYLTVAEEGTLASTCNLKIVTEATESTGGTTGLPAETVQADEVPVTTTKNEDGSFKIMTIATATASPCEITDICASENKISFEANIGASAAGETTSAVTGTVLVKPGDVQATVTGTGEFSDTTMNSLDVAGTTTINGTNAEVTLVCQP